MNFKEALAQADLGFKLTYDGFEGHITGTGLNGGKHEYVHKSSEDGEYKEYKASAQDKAEEGWYAL